MNLFGAPVPQELPVRAERPIIAVRPEKKTYVTCNKKYSDLHRYLDIKSVGTPICRLNAKFSKTSTKKKHFFSVFSLQFE